LVPTSLEFPHLVSRYGAELVHPRLKMPGDDDGRGREEASAGECGSDKDGAQDRCKPSVSTAQKAVLLTGATDGIGKLQAMQLASMPNLRLFLHGRNRDKGAKLLEELNETSAEGTQITYHIADLADLLQVRSLASTIRQELEQSGRGILDVLINNAGVGPIPGVSREGHSLIYAVNLFAPYYLTELLQSNMSAGSRVVYVGSRSMTKDDASFDFDDALGVKEESLYTTYNRSKLSIAHLGLQQAARWTEHGITVNIVNPMSMMATGIVPSSMATGDPNVGAQNVVAGALGEVFEDKTGAYADGDDAMKIKDVPQQEEIQILSRLEELVRQTVGLPSLAASNS